MVNGLGSEKWRKWGRFNGGWINNGAERGGGKEEGGVRGSVVVDGELALHDGCGRKSREGSTLQRRWLEKRVK